MLDILNDPEINCVIETIGGIDEAKDIVFRAIEANKHVITANKALIATYLSELLQLLREHPTVQFGYEASVCGGIPIINTLQTTYLGDTVQKVPTFPRLSLTFCSSVVWNNEWNNKFYAQQNGSRRSRLYFSSP